MEIIEVTLPIFLFIAAGYAARKKGIIRIETRDFLSRLVYYFAMPALIIRSILSFDFSETFRLDLVAHNLLITAVMCIASFFAAYMIKERRKRGAFNMGCFRSNQGYMGMPVINGFYGTSAMSKAAVINGFDSPFVVFLSAVTLGIYGMDKRGLTAGGKSPGRAAQSKLTAVIANPLVLAAFAGLCLSYLDVGLLEIKAIDEFLRTAGYMAFPLALITIGASLKVGSIRKNIRLVIAAAAVKLIVMPFTAYMLAVYLFRFTGEDIGICVMLTAMPTSVSSYIMAAEMGADEEVMATCIGLTTFLSVLTVSVIRFLLK